jgi:hypothetical protein
MTQEPEWHEVFVDEEVHHFLHTMAEKNNTSENEVLRSMIFGEKAGMTAELREQLAREEEAHAQASIGDPAAMKATYEEHKKFKGS